MPTLSDAIAAIKAGRRDEARVMLSRILADDGNNITALLWMTEVSKTPEERRKYLNRILAIDPTNAPARKGLELLDKADKPLPLVATAQPLTGQPTSADAAEDHRISPDERKPQQVPTATPALVKVTTPKAKPAQVSPPKAKWTTTEHMIIGGIIGLVAIIVVAVALSAVSRSLQDQSTRAEPAAAPRQIPTERKAPTPSPNPILGDLRQYPWVNELDLIKRPDYYKNKPICLDEMKVYNVREDQGSTTFTIQAESGSYPVIGTVYYAGTIPDLLDDSSIIIGGYVAGTESELNVSSSSRPVILMQKYHWFSSNNQFHDFTTGDGNVAKCKYMEPEALLGHWVIEDGSTHYYIDQQKITMIDNGKPYGILKYTVLETNNRDNSITISTLSSGTGYKAGVDRYFVFAPDRKSFIQTITAFGATVSSRIDYVDSKTTP